MFPLAQLRIGGQRGAGGLVRMWARSWKRQREEIWSARECENAGHVFLRNFSHYLALTNSLKKKGECYSKDFWMKIETLLRLSTVIYRIINISAH